MRLLLENPDRRRPQQEERLFGQDELLKRLSLLCIPYQEYTHTPEGNTFDATQLRGHRLSEAAKSLLVELCFGAKHRVFCISVLCGDERLDLTRLAELFKARKARLASKDYVARLTGCPIGAVLPVSFADDIKVVADNRLFEQQKLVFNSGVLNRSIEIAPEAYLQLASPSVLRIGCECL